MKTNLATFFFLLFICHSAFSQRINFEQDSLDTVLAKAKQLNKPVFILLSGPEIGKDVPKQLREQMLGSGLDDADLTAAYNSQFINFKAPYRSTASTRLGSKYNVRAFPTFLYLNPEGMLIHRNHGNYSTPRRYLDDIKAFEDKLNSTHNLGFYGQEFEKGRRDADFLRQYLQLHKEMGVEPTIELLDAYAGSLSEAGVVSFSDVIFIHEFGPLVGGKAFQYARSKQVLVDSLYKTLPYSKRVEINNKIIVNTMRTAIETKDKTMAERGAGFARSTWNNDRSRGQRVYLSNMLSFFRGTKDTANYILSALTYYNRYFMAIPQDSAAKVVANEKRMQKARTAAGPAIAGNLKQAGLQAETMVITRYEPAPSSYTMELNNAAYHMYQTGTTNKLALRTAADWSKRTVTLDPTVAYYHTYAVLLYKLENFNESEESIQSAIKLAKQQNASTDWLQETLRKIKSRNLK